MTANNSWRVISRPCFIPLLVLVSVCLAFGPSAVSFGQATEEAEGEAETTAPAGAAEPATVTEQASEGTDESAAEAPPAAEAAATGPAAEFATVFGSWKAILKQLREMQAKYAIAEPEELEQIRADWDAKIAEGEKLMPRLRASAQAAFLASPGSDPELQKLLLEMIADDIRRDDYARAKELALPMAESGDTDPRLMNLLGIAAFATNDFAMAEKYLNEADRAGSLTEQSEAFLPLVKDNLEWWAQEEKLRALEAAADDLPRVKLETTAGDIVLELFENEAPETVGNFISLVEKGFYDGLTFHRVVPGFMAQGGCPNGDGSGGPGYNIYCECYGENHRNHFAGSISMAKETARNTGGSQFYITFVPTSHLNGKHTVFGRVLEGMDVLPRIQRVNPEDPSPTAERTQIKRATVVRKRDHEYAPNKVK